MLIFFKLVFFSSIFFFLYSIVYFLTVYLKIIKDKSNVKLKQEFSNVVFDEIINGLKFRNRDLLSPLNFQKDLFGSKVDDMIFAASLFRFDQKKENQQLVNYGNNAEFFNLFNEIYERSTLILLNSRLNEMDFSKYVDNIIGNRLSHA